MKIAIRPSSKWILLAIVCLAAFLRFYGIDYGLPHKYLHDESVEVVRALRLGAGEYNWSFDRAQRGAFYYLLFVEYAVYFVVLWITGGVQGPDQFAQLFVQDPSPFFLMGRVTAALFGVATVAVLYLFGRRFAGRAACLAASLFLSVAYLHVKESHAIALDVPLTFFTTLSFYYMTRMTERDAWPDYVLAGLCVTLASLHKVYMVLLLAPFIAAHLWRTLGQARSGSRWKSVLDRKLLLTAAGCLVLYLAANPGILLHAKAFLERINVFYGSSQVPDKIVINYWGTQVPGLLFYVESFFHSFGFGIAVLGLAGLLVAALVEDRRHWIFLGFFGLHVALFATTRGMFSHRYLLPIYPLFALYAGMVLAKLVHGATRKTVLVAPAALLLVIQPLAKDLALDIRYRKKDTRTLGREWFEANVPAGSRVLIHGLRTFPNICSVPLDPSPESVEDSITKYYAEESGSVEANIRDNYGRDSRKAALLRNVLKPALKPHSYYLVLNGEHMERRPWQDYVDRGIQYAVVCECEDDLYLNPEGRRQFPEIADIYLRLQDPSIATLVKRFERTPDRPGPEIRIYRIRGAGSATGRTPPEASDAALQGTIVPGPPGT